MLTLKLLQTCLVLHITGLTMMAGTTLVDTLIYKQFWKQYNADKSRATAILEATAKISKLFAIGFLLLLVSGVIIMLLTNGVYGEQTWFRIKMLLVVAIVANGIVVGRRTGLKIRKAVSGETTAPAELATLKGRLFAFHTIQLLLFAVIFVLGVFKFN